MRNWSSGWLPPQFQGTVFREQGSPVLHLQPSTERPVPIEAARARLLRELNERHLSERPGELELNARIESFELAGRMQLAATDALDLTQETEATQQLYGLDDPKTKSYGTRCLMARRLVERGVRFVSLFMAGQPWDTHTDNNNRTRDCCAQTDRPIGALMADLKQRGLLDSTPDLVGRRIRSHARSREAQQRHALRAGTTTRTGSASGWPAAAASTAGRHTARPTTSATVPSRTARRRPICTQRSCT